MKAKYSVGQFGRVLFLALVVGITGCVGYVGPGYGEVGYVGPVIEGPDVVVFGGHEHGHYDRDFGRRGRESRHWR